MNSRLFVPVLALACLLPACNFSPIPTDRDINVNGSYTGRLVGYNDTSALLDVTIQEQNLQVSARVRSRVTGETFTLSGTRSVYSASPVSISLTTALGSGSVCPGGFTEQYGVNATFYAAKQDSASGSVRHSLCNATTASFEPTNINSGMLELVRN